VFETSEHSWHGFEKISLPEEKKHFSRKLLSIYLYTRERPADEIAPPHGTFYAQRPLPARLIPGHTLDENDAKQIDELITRRNHWIEYYQKRELTDSARIQQYISHIHRNTQEIEELKAHLNELGQELKRLRWVRALLPKKVAAQTAAKLDCAPIRPSPPAEATAEKKAESTPWVGPAPPAAQVPLAGYASQEGLAQGFWPDGWIGSPFEMSIRLRQPVEGVRITGYLPDSHPELVLEISVNGRDAGRGIVPSGAFSLSAACQVGAGELMQLKIAADKSYSPARAGASTDARELVVVLWEVLLLHPSPA
jgi:hypothetical protein